MYVNNAVSCYKLSLSQATIVCYFIFAEESFNIFNELFMASWKDKKNENSIKWQIVKANWVDLAVLNRILNFLLKEEGCFS